MMSDDAEHACMTAQALLAAPLDESRFARSLAWRLRGWLAALPAAVGWGTLRAIVRLWLGFSPGRSGVRSAGNGPAMRAPILGACLAYAPERIEPMVIASTRLTHRDPRAEAGALAIALAAAHAARSGPDGVDPIALLSEIRARIAHADPIVDPLRDALDLAAIDLARGASPMEFVRALGLEHGVSGYMLHTVPAALYCWLASPADVRRCVEAIILLGGDVDSTGAIVGALAGATAGASAIPEEWLGGIADWPRSVSWMRRLGARLAEEPAFGVDGGDGAGRRTGAGPLALFWPALPARNLLFLTVALGHGLRRMLPPY